MSPLRYFLMMCALLLLLTTGSSCRLWKKAFGPKYGCKTTQWNIGAERLLSGEKVKKQKKFRA